MLLLISPFTPKEICNKNEFVFYSSFTWGVVKQETMFSEFLNFLLIVRSIMTVDDINSENENFSN